MDCKIIFQSFFIIFHYLFRSGVDMWANSPFDFSERGTRDCMFLQIALKTMLYTYTNKLNFIILRYRKRRIPKHSFRKEFATFIGLSVF